MHASGLLPDWRLFALMPRGCADARRHDHTHDASATGARAREQACRQRKLRTRRPAPSCKKCNSALGDARLRQEGHARLSARAAAPRPGSRSCDALAAELWSPRCPTTPTAVTRACSRCANEIQDILRIAWRANAWREGAGSGQLHDTCRRCSARCRKDVGSLVSGGCGCRGRLFGV